MRELEPEISLVCEDGGEIVGHVMLTRMEMGEHGVRGAVTFPAVFG